MSKAKYVKEFDFNEKACNYETGGAATHKMPGGKTMKNSEMGYKKGGSVKEKATGEVYPSRKAMEKHEKEETPRMQREELIQRATVKAPVRKSVPVAPAGPLIALKKGGAVPKAGAFKIPKVMTEFKEGKLHSGSKKGPEVTNPKQAVAIAMSEARKAGKR